MMFWISGLYLRIGSNIAGPDLTEIYDPTPSDAAKHVREALAKPADDDATAGAASQATAKGPTNEHEDAPAATMDLS